MLMYHFKIKEEDSGFSAESVELKGCRTEADSTEELLLNMKEALDLYLDEPSASKIFIPEPKKYRKLPPNIIAVEPDHKIILAQLIRQARIKAGKTQTEMAKELNFKAVSQYQKLEKKSNPTVETLLKLKVVLPEFRLDLIFS